MDEINGMLIQTKGRHLMWNLKIIQEPPTWEICVIVGRLAAGGPLDHLKRLTLIRFIMYSSHEGQKKKKFHVWTTFYNFVERGPHGVCHTHDDALIVTLEITNFATRRVLIDNGCSTYIGHDKLHPIVPPMVGFKRSSFYPLGIVTLPVCRRYLPQARDEEYWFPSSRMPLSLQFHYLMTCA